MRLNVYGIEALTKFLDAMTTQQAHQFIVVRTDSHQAYLPSNERGFIIEVYDSENHYIETWHLNDKLFTLQEAKEHLGTEETHVKNFFGVHDGTASTDDN
jgi:hypothetical protein